jgi:dienelactone hydrolase
MNLISEDYYQEMDSFYKNKLLKSIENKIDSKKVVLIGHSVGGTIALDILKQDYDIIDKCVLLFLFLGRPGHKGKIVLNTVGALVKNKRFIPFLLTKRSIIDLLNPSFAKISDNEIEASLMFAYHERKTFGKVKKVKKLESSILEKVITLTCPKDTWCQNKYLLQAGLNINELKVSHDFVVEAKQRQMVNKHLIRNI